MPALTFAVRLRHHPARPLLALAVFLALLATGSFALLSFGTASMAHDAEVINQMGLVRGSIQRATKMELAGLSSAPLLEEVDHRFGVFADFFADHRGAGQLPAEMFRQLEERWAELNALFLHYRETPSANLRAALIDTSEACWQLADETTLALQRASEGKLRLLQGLRFVLLLNLILLGAAFWRAGLLLGRESRRRTRSESAYRALMENAIDAILVLDDRQRIIDVNHHAEQLSGYSKAALLSRAVGDLSPPRQAAEVRAARRQLRKDGSFLGEGQLLTAAGYLIPVEVAGTRLELDSTPLYLVHIRDITERRCYEQALLQRADELEERVTDRTLALQAANAELESFSYSVAHDLRAPLRAINGFSHALREDCGAALDEDGRRYLERIEQATVRMGELIDGLLDLSCVFRTELKQERVDLSAMAEELARSLKRSAPHPVSFVIEPGLSAVGDAALLWLLLENLFSNACKFSAARPDPQVEFGQLREDGQARYYVRDNGVGFEMEYARKLFLPFERLHAPGDYPGTGIGLATVRRIVQRHYGVVWAESAPGRGATFYFTLAEAGQVEVTPPGGRPAVEMGGTRLP